MSVFLKGKKILLIQQRGWGVRIGHFLAKKLQAEGCRLAALTFKKSTYNFVASQKEVKYDLVISDDEVAEDPEQYLDGDEFSLAEINEALGIDSLWSLVPSLRHYAWSYVTKFAYGFGQNMSDEEIKTYLKAVYKYINVFYDQFRPDLIIAPAFSDMRHAMFNLFAKRRGIPMLAVTDSKVQGILVFSYSYLDDEGPFIKRIDGLNSGRTDSPNRARAAKYIAEFRRSFKRPGYMEHLYQQPSLWKMVKQELKPYYQILLWYWKGGARNSASRLGITADWRPPRIILRDHYAQRKYQKFIDQFDYYPIDKLAKFAYLPLQFQPESPVDMLAPYFSNQIEVARQIAQSLPDDYTLAVKEHPAMAGRRTPGYYQKLTRLPNVKLIDYRIPSGEVLQKTALVVSPSGTTLAESAFYQKPAIQLGNLGTTLKLPNVVKHTDMTTLSDKIKEVLRRDMRTDDYERRLENFVAAAYDTGFDFEYLEVWHRGKKEDLERLWDIFKKEIEQALK